MTMVRYATSVLIIYVLALFCEDNPDYLSVFLV